MPLLDRSGRAVADPWTRVADDAALPSGPSIVSPARLAALADRTGQLGVALDVGGDLAAVAPWLDRLALVVVPFPGFRDGRGFTTARTLRERHGFTSEVRASGPLLPDQYVALIRVGVSTVELPDTADLAEWTEALRLHGPFSTSEPLPWIRRHALPFGAT